MAPLVKKPAGTPLWQIRLLLGAGMVAGLYILKPGFDQYWREKAEKLAAEKKDNQ